MGSFKKLVKKAQAPTEPDLTTAELMLTNTDLQPGEMPFTLTVSLAIGSLGRRSVY